MNMMQTILLAAGVASTMLLCICAIVGCGQLHRLVEGVNQLVDLALQAEQRQQAIMANIRGRDFDPKQ